MDVLSAKSEQFIDKFVLIFIAASIWSKTWFSIIIPLVMLGPAFFMERINANEETILYGSAAVSIIACLFIIVWPIFMKAKKQPER